VSVLFSKPMDYNWQLRLSSACADGFKKTKPLSSALGRWIFPVLRPKTKTLTVRHYCW
jgi:hypothetical protein